MCRTLGLVCILLLSLAPLAPAQSLASGGGRFTIEHYAKVARVSDVRIAPAGDRAVMVVAWPNYETNAWESEIVLVDLRSKVQRTLTRRKTASSPRWSPNGDRLAFLASVDGRPQVFVIPADGGEAEAWTKAQNGVGIFAWKPDGNGFAYTTVPEEPKRAKFDDAFEVNANDYLTLSAPRSAHVYTIQKAGGEPGLVASGEWTVPSLLTVLAWSPDGRTLTFTRQAGPGTRDREKRAVVVADLRTGAVSTVGGIDTRLCSAAWPSPDGKVLLASCPVDGHMKNQSELVVLPAAGGTPQRLTAGLDRNVSRGTWSADSRSVVASASDGTRSGLWELSLQGPPRRRDVGAVGVGDLDVARDGTIAFVGTEPQRPPELFVLRPGASGPERLTDLHAEVAALSLGRVEAMAWRGESGLPLSGVLTFPPGFDATRKYPLLLNIHGGPWISSRETFSERSQLFASKGWIVFEPNYRGSDNMGNALFAAVYRDHGAGPGRDVMEGVALLKQRPYVDSTRIGVSGWSYGGYMTTWLIGHYQGWKAAMAGAAVIDLADDYNLNDVSLFIRAYGDTLSFPGDLALMKEQSPLTYVDDMKTPLLLLSDTGDVRVPVTQSYKLYNALRERGRDVRMVLWPVGGHFPADPYRARDIDRRWAEFFEEWLK